MVRVELAGYQGAGSVHTRALEGLASRLALAGFAPQVEADVTASGSTARAMFDAVERGKGPHLCYVASGYLTERVPALDLLDLPFQVSDRARALAALDGSVGEALSRVVSATTGQRVLAYWDNGFRHLSNRIRPVREVADCKGLVVRTLDSRVYQETLRAMGMTPVVTDVLDLQAAVASGRVDAQENPLTNFRLFELWRHHPFVSLTGHLFGVALLVCNRAWFESLPENAAERLEEAVVRTTAVQRNLAAAEDAVILERLAGLGVSVIEPGGADRASFIEACRALVQREAMQLDPDLLAAYAG